MIQKINSVLPVARGHFAMKMKVGVCDRDPDKSKIKNQNPSKFIFFVTLAYLRAQSFSKL